MWQEIKTMPNDPGPCRGSCAYELISWLQRWFKVANSAVLGIFPANKLLKLLLLSGRLWGQVYLSLP